MGRREEGKGWDGGKGGEEVARAQERERERGEGAVIMERDREEGKQT